MFMNTTSKIVPINNGYYSTKGLLGTIYRSLVQEVSYNNNIGSNDVITYNNKSYVIGVGEPNLTMDKTKDDFNKLLILNMLANFMGKEKKAIFKVALTLPISVYFEQDEQEFANYLKGNYNIKFNGRDREITIEDVKVFPETAITYLNLEIDEELEDKTMYIIDIGGYAANICRIRGGEFSKEDYITIQHGMYHLDFEISQFLNQKLYKQDLNCNYADIREYRKHGLYLNDEINQMDFYKEDIKDLEKKFIKTLLNSCKTKKWNMKAFPTLITGGGGQTLYNLINEEFLNKSVLSDDPLFDNVKALDKLGVDAFIE